MAQLVLGADQEKFKVVVFVPTVHNVEFLCKLFDESEQFSSRQFSCPLYQLHGDMIQGTRIAVFRKFMAKESAILFTTDVAARGLDLPDVDWIVQYSPPLEETEYIHRVGQTARAGGKGKALLFLMPHEVEYVKLLEERGLVMERTDERKIWRAYRDISGKDELTPYKQAMADMQLALEQILLANDNICQLARRAFR